MDDRLYMMLQLQQISFMLVDLNLYLDTHPNDTIALANYNQLSREFDAMRKEFSMKYGAIMNFGHCEAGTESFNWVNSPWPWMKSANPSPM